MNKQEKQKPTEKIKPIATSEDINTEYDKLKKTAQLLYKRNQELELEVGRLHMENRAYKQQYDNMSNIINKLAPQKNDQVK